MTELIDKWEVVNKLIQLENNYQFYKEQWDADVLYRRICELEIGIGKTPGVTVQNAEDINVLSKWISVKDRLPKENETALVYVYMNGDMIKAVRRGNKWYSTWDNVTEIVYVSHWMPLPQPPKGE